MSSGECYAVFDTGDHRPEHIWPVLLLDLSDGVGTSQEGPVDALKQHSSTRMTLTSTLQKGPGKSAD